jgi:hypothetical protein
MVLTKPELIEALHKEVRILLHLMTEVDPAWLDYRPTPGQRSTIELLRYLTMMGPRLIEVARAGKFVTADWTAHEEAASRLTFDQARDAIAAHKDEYTRLLSGMADDELRAEVSLFGDTSSRGSFIVRNVLSGCALPHAAVPE